MHTTLRHAQLPMSGELLNRSWRRLRATPISKAGYENRTIKELLGDRDVSTTMIYTHVLNRGGRGVRSPLDQRAPPHPVAQSDRPQGSPVADRSIEIGLF